MERKLTITMNNLRTTLDANNIKTLKTYKMQREWLLFDLNGIEYTCYILKYFDYRKKAIYVSNNSGNVGLFYNYIEDLINQLILNQKENKI